MVAGPQKTARYERKQGTNGAAGQQVARQLGDLSAISRRSLDDVSLISRRCLGDVSAMSRT